MIRYVWNRIMKKLPGSAIRNTHMEKPSRVEAGSTLINTHIGSYSYAGYGCTIINCSIGKFCSISDNVSIGLAEHPMTWASTSCAFYDGRDSIPKDLARLHYQMAEHYTTIENDVWIGKNTMIKSGVTVHTGAVLGMGSVVTADVPPYAVVAGVPARIIRYRFDESTRERLLSSRWWEMKKEELRQYTQYMNDPEAFLHAIETNRLKQG